MGGGGAVDCWVHRSRVRVVVSARCRRGDRAKGEREGEGTSERWAAGGQVCSRRVPALTSFDHRPNQSTAGWGRWGWWVNVCWCRRSWWRCSTEKRGRGAVGERSIRTSRDRACLIEWCRQRRYCLLRVLPPPPQGECRCLPYGRDETCLCWDEKINAVKSWFVVPRARSAANRSARQSQYFKYEG